MCRIVPVLLLTPHVLSPFCYRQLAFKALRLIWNELNHFVNRPPAVSLITVAWGLKIMSSLCHQVQPEQHSKQTVKAISESGEIIWGSNPKIKREIRNSVCLHHLPSPCITLILLPQGINVVTAHSQSITAQYSFPASENVTSYT